MASKAPPKAPRFDEITVDFYPGYREPIYRLVPGYTIPILEIGIQDTYILTGYHNKWDKKGGTANAFVEVAPKTDVASFTVRTTPSGQHLALAGLSVNCSKEPGGTSLKLEATGSPSQAGLRGPQGITGRSPVRLPPLLARS
ncbi:MAG: hypothetical protein R2882_12900 [Gemmatimonadales bacterium]